MLVAFGALFGAVLMGAHTAAAEVDPTGAFETSVAIKVPPFHGLEPRLSLVYSSSGPTGWAGMGWSLSGLSTVQRQSSSGGLPRNFDDTFTLDGQDLIPCPAAGDGNSLARSPSCLHRVPGLVPYTTRVESYQRIAFERAPPNSTGRPDQWLVWRTDGVKATYAPGLITSWGVLDWRLSKVEDLSGNTVHYDWVAAERGQVSVLHRIRYGDVEIIFQTEPRHDPITVATGAGLVTSSTRLQVIDQFAGGHRIRAYALRYTTNLHSSTRSFLQSVQEYGSDAIVDAGGVRGPTALPATTFGSPEIGRRTAPWTPRATGSAPDWTTGWPAGPDHSFNATLNGGRQGALRWPSWEASHFLWLTLDYNGDGRTDFALVEPKSGAGGFQLSVELAEPGGGYRGLQRWVPWPAAGFHRYTTPRLLVADVNGDGIDDLVVAREGVVVTLFGGEDLSFQNDPVERLTNIPPGWEYGLMLGDVTGDGLADLVAVGRHAAPSTGECPGRLRAWTGTGRGGFNYVHPATPVGAPTPGCWPESPFVPAAEFRLADVNGDLKADVVAFQAANTESRWPVHNARIFSAITDGAGGFTTSVQDTGQVWTTTTEDPPTVVPCPKHIGNQNTCRQSRSTFLSAFWSDADGDGRSDLLVLRPGGTGQPDERLAAWTGLSNGDGTYRGPSAGGTPFANRDVQQNTIYVWSNPQHDWVVAVPPPPLPRWPTADFNGDGAGDLGRVTQIDKAGSQQQTLRAMSNRRGTWDSNASSETIWRCPAGCRNPNAPSLLTTVGDVNGDGQDDVMFAHSGGGPEPWTGLGVDATSRVASAAQVLSGDVNADGRPDLLYPTMTTAGNVQVRVMQQRADRTYHPVASVTVPVGRPLAQRGWLVADINGDRRADLVNLDLHATVLLATDGPGWLVAPTSPLPLPRGGRWSVADINGDGRDDLARVGPAPAGVHVMLGEPNGGLRRDLAATPPTVDRGHLVDSLHWLPADVDGDEQTDLIYVNALSGKVEALIRRGMGWYHKWSSVALSPNPPSAREKVSDRILSIGGDEPTWRGLDVNADGAVDLARASVDSDGSVLVETLRSHGDGTFSPRTQRVGPDKVAGGPQAGADGQHWKPGDIDHDGRGDLVRVFNRVPDLVIQAALSNGDGRWRLKTWPTDAMGPQPATSNWQVGDWEGSGQASAIRIDETALVLTISGFVATAPYEVITEVTNGVGASTTIEYSPGTSMLPGDTTPPECRLPFGVSATPVVTRLSTSDTATGTSDATSTTYRCLQYSTELRRSVAWRESWSIHEAAINRPASTEYVLRDVLPSGIVQPVLDEVRDEHGPLRVTRSHYHPAGEQPQTDLLAGTAISECAAGQCATSTVELDHDAYGNITTTHEEAAGSGRQRVTDTAYLYDHDRWLHALPRHTQTRDPTQPDRVLRATLVCYDDDTTADCTKLPAQRGLATLTRSWNDTTGSYVTTAEADYDPFGNQTTTTDANSNPTTTTFDPQLHLHPIKVCNALDQCIEQPEPWDRRADAPRLSIDVNGAETRSTYDPLGRPEKTERPSADQDVVIAETTSYQTDDTVGTVTLTTTTVPGFSPMWTRTFTDGLHRRYRLERLGGDGTRTVQTVTQYSDGSTRPFRSGLPRFTDDPPVWETTTYDVIGRPLSHAHADGASVTIGYSVLDGLVVTDTRDEQSRLQTNMTDGWDALIRVSQTSVAAPPPPYNPYPAEVGQSSASLKPSEPGEPPVISVPPVSTRYTYNAVGDLETITDPAGNTMRSQFDSFGRKTAEDDPDRGRTSYTYDGVGNLLGKTDARGRQMAYAYDELNRLIQKADLATGATSTWHYDQEQDHGASVGRLTSVQDSSAAGCPENISRSLTYDAIGNMTNDARCVRGSTVAFLSTYDPLNRLDTLTYPDGEKLTYGYDEAGHIVTISGYVVDMQYNAAGQLTSAEYANHTRNVWNYSSSRDWLDSQTVATSSGQQLFDDTTTRDDSGLVLTATSGSNSTAETYGYDPLGRLINVTGSWQQQFTYNDIGNIASNSAVGSYNYPTHRQCTAGPGGEQCAGPHAVVRAGRSSGTSYEYDATGNMTAVHDNADAATKGPETAGKLEYVVQAKEPGKRRDTLWALASDHLGDPWRWPEIYALNAGKPYPEPPGRQFNDPHWIYPGQHLLIPAAGSSNEHAPPASRTMVWNTEGQLTQVQDNVVGTITNLYDADGTRVQQTSHSGTTKFYGPLADWTAPAGLNKYIYAGSLLVARHQGTQQLWYTLDRLGSPRLTTNQTGAVTRRHNYAPYGQNTGRTGNGEPIGYTGHRGIGKTDLIDMLARPYDPKLGRMLSADSIIPDHANPQALNRYSYAYNNPVNYTDPTGHFPIQESGVRVDGRNLYGMFGEEKLSGASFRGGGPPTTSNGQPIFSTERITAAWMQKVPAPTPTCSERTSAASPGKTAQGTVEAPRPGYQTPRTGYIESVDVRTGVAADTTTTDYLELTPEQAAEAGDPQYWSDVIVVTGGPANQQNQFAPNVLAYLGYRGPGIPMVDRRPTSQLEWAAGGLLLAPAVAVGGVYASTTGPGLWFAFSLRLYVAHPGVSNAGLGVLGGFANAHSRLVPATARTGRVVAENLIEQLAMQVARSNPGAGYLAQSRAMGDGRWHAIAGWVKMQQVVNGVNIHYTYNVITGAADDFKFK